LNDQIRCKCGRMMPRSSETSCWECRKREGRKEAIVAGVAGAFARAEIAEAKKKKGKKEDDHAESKER